MWADPHGGGGDEQILGLRTHRHIDRSEGRQRGVLGWEGLPVRIIHVSPAVSESPLCLFLPAEWHRGWACSPCGQDGMGVLARADILRDVGVGLAGGAQQCVIGLADRQEEGGMVARGQLDDVCH